MPAVGASRAPCMQRSTLDACNRHDKEKASLRSCRFHPSFSLVTSVALFDLIFQRSFLPALRAPLRDLSAPGGRMLYGASASASPPSGFTAPSEVPP